MSEYNIKVYVKKGKKGCWNRKGGMEYLKGTIQFAKKTSTGLYHIENTNKDFPDYNYWAVSDDEIIFLNDDEDDATVELNGKTYRKKDLEEALAKLEPVE